MGRLENRGSIVPISHCVSVAVYFVITVCCVSHCVFVSILCHANVSVCWYSLFAVDCFQAEEQGRVCPDPETLPLHSTQRPDQTADDSGQ